MSQAPVHHATTSGTTTGHTQHTTHTTDNIAPVQHQQHQSTLSPTDNNDVDTSQLSASERRRSSLAPTYNPMVPADSIANSDKAELSSSVGTHNAPGKAGEIGEDVLGAFGFGGSTVERPKEDQGLGEKIVNLMGA